MNMGQYERYFANKPLPGRVDPILFRWILALHDSGKPIIDGIGDGRTGSHAVTIDITRKELAKRGYTEKILIWRFRLSMKISLVHMSMQDRSIMT